MSKIEAVSPVYSIIEAALSFVGAGIAGTLWWAHQHNIDLPCTGDGHGCDIVAQSRWAHLTWGPWHEVPVALLGFLTYLLLLTLSLMKLGIDSPRPAQRLHFALWAISAFAAGYSIYLQYVAHFKIGAFCPWCFSSACVMTALFLVTTLEKWRGRRQSSDQDALKVSITHG